MRNVILIKSYGLIVGLIAAALAIAGISESTRKRGTITPDQYGAIIVGKVDRQDVLLYFGQPHRPLVVANEVEMENATRRKSPCLVYKSDARPTDRYRFCFDVADNMLVSKHIEVS